LEIPAVVTEVPGVAQPGLFKPIACVQPSSVLLQRGRPAAEPARAAPARRGSRHRRYTGDGAFYLLTPGYDPKYAPRAIERGIVKVIPHLPYFHCRSINKTPAEVN